MWRQKLGWSKLQGLDVAVLKEVTFGARWLGQGMLLPWHILPGTSSSADQTFMMFTALEEEGSRRILASQVEMSLFAIQVPQGFPLIKPWHSPFGWLERQAGFVLCHQRRGMDFPNRILLIQSHFLKKNRADYLFRACCWFFGSRCLQLVSP